MQALLKETGVCGEALLCAFTRAQADKDPSSAASGSKDILSAHVSWRWEDSPWGHLRPLSLDMAHALSIHCPSVRTGHIPTPGGEQMRNDVPGGQPLPRACSAPRRRSKLLGRTAGYRCHKEHAKQRTYVTQWSSQCTKETLGKYFYNHRQRPLWWLDFVMTWNSESVFF